MGSPERSGRDRHSGRTLNPRQRIAAIAALVLAPAVLILSLAIVVAQFPRGLIVLGCVVVAIGAALFGLTRKGFPRLLALGVALAAVIAQAVLLATDGDHLLQAIAIVVGLGAATYAARTAFRVRVHLPAGARSRTSGASLQPEVGRGQGRALLSRR